MTEKQPQVEAGVKPMSEISPEMEARFRKAFPLYAMGAPSQRDLLLYIEAERTDAGLKGIMLGRYEERIELARILDATTVDGNAKLLKDQMLGHLLQDMEAMTEPKPNEHETPAA